MHLNILFSVCQLSAAPVAVAIHASILGLSCESINIKAVSSAIARIIVRMAG